MKPFINVVTFFNGFRGEKIIIEVVIPIKNIVEITENTIMYMRDQHCIEYGIEKGEYERLKELLCQ